jgi:hypothetical protein
LFLIGRLFGGSSGGSLSLGKDLLELGLGGSDLGGIDHWGGSFGEGGNGNTWRDGDVSSGNPEPVDGVGDVVNALDKTVGVDITVGTTSDTVGCVDLFLGGVAVLVSMLYNFFLR